MNTVLISILVFVLGTIIGIVSVIVVNILKTKKNEKTAIGIIEKAKKDGFLEYSNHFENYYGTPKDFVMEKLKNNDVLLEIDVNGGLNVKKSYPEALLIMVVPPSLEEIENRLINRHTESLEKIKLRMQRIDYELEKASLYDYTVVNDDLEQAIIEIEDIINKEKNKQN